MGITKFNELINAILDDDFELFFSGKNHPSEKEIESYAAEINCNFPDDFKCLSSSYLNGFLAEAKENVWPRKQGGAHWMFQYALIIYGLDSGLPDWVNLRHEVNEFRDKTKTDLTPFMRTISCSEPYCFTSDGQIVKWSNDAWKAKLTESSFYDVFKQELVELHTLKERAISENI